MKSMDLLSPEKILEEILINSKEIFNSLIYEIEKLTKIERNSDSIFILLK
jgi:hypothetical protein